MLHPGCAKLTAKIPDLGSLGAPALTVAWFARFRARSELTGRARMAKRSTTTKDVGLVQQLWETSQLKLAPEFQRNAVWPRAAKAYLIDTILMDRPMPLFFFQRSHSAQTGKPVYSVVDGQQRLRAIFEFLGDRFSLTESKDRRWRGKKYSELPKALRETLLNYDITIEELSSYREDDIRDIFVRMNKYVVKLSPQELRHARDHGKFYDFVEDLAKLPFWREQRVFTKHQLARMKAAEFSAEISILMIEGPQDKKSSLDLYYQEYRSRFPEGSDIRTRLGAYVDWIVAAIPDFKKSRFRKPTDLYGLIGALEIASRGGKRLNKIDPVEAGQALTAFEKETRSVRPSRAAAAYVLAASRQTDNLGPRTTRMEVLSQLLG